MCSTNCDYTILLLILILLLLLLNFNFDQESKERNGNSNSGANAEPPPKDDFWVESEPSASDIEVFERIYDEAQAPFLVADVNAVKRLLPQMQRPQMRTRHRAD